MNDEHKDAVRQRLEAQLEEAQAEVDRLEARMQRADAQARIALQRDLESLTSHTDEVRRRLADVADASGDAWDDLKTGLDSASRDLAAALRNATSRFGE